MQRLLYSIFISFFLIISCAKSKPEGVVSESKITEILTEVSILDGYLNQLPSDSSRKVMPVLYGKIFQKYDLDSASFVKNLDYYFGDPNLTEKIYTVVNKNLNKYEREFHAEDSTRNAFQQDSIQRVHYFQRVYSKIENLRHYSASDTAYKNYYEFNKRLVSSSNLEFLNYYFNMLPSPNLDALNKTDSTSNKEPEGTPEHKDAKEPGEEMPDSLVLKKRDTVIRKVMDERRKLEQNTEIVKPVKPVKRQLPQ